MIQYLCKCKNMKGKRYASTLFDIDPRALGSLTAALVDENLVSNYLRLNGMLDKIYIEIVAEKLVHRFVDKGVCDRLLGLVFVGGHRREAV